MQFDLSAPDSRSLQEFREILSKRNVDRGLSVAINESLREGIKETENIVSRYYNIPQPYLSKMEHKKSSESSLSGYIMGDKTPIPLGVFPRSESKRGGVTVKVRRSKASYLKFAFIVKGMPKHVFGRGFYRGAAPFGFMTAYKNPGQDEERLSLLVTTSLHGALTHRNVQSQLNNFLDQQLSENVNIILNERIRKVNNIKSK